MQRSFRIVRLAAVLTAALVAVVLGVRAWTALVGPPLEPWLVWSPQEPDDVEAMGWDDWLAAEAGVFAELRAELTGPLAPEHRQAISRYNEDSRVWPGRFAQDFNRSFEIAPDGPPRGAVVLLHGLTDAPFSMRHIAGRYAARGWVALVPRMPGHGTTPAGLIAVDWPEWMAAVRMAARAAATRAPGRPLHLVGFSNGGALAVKYALEALEDPDLPRPERITLISPMIGITAFARFAGLAGWPALLPALARAAWLDVLPEFNPFKYNSFPVNGAVQAHRLTRAVQDGIRRAGRRGLLAGLPPILTFQSAVDSTVSTPAVLSGLYAHLPANGSALALFDVNRASPFHPLLTRSAATAAERLVPPAPRAWDLIVVGAAGPDDPAAVARVTPAGSVAVEPRPLGAEFPREIFSLGHVALPFPPWDGLYGLRPDPAEDFGVRLGTAPLRGELGALSAPADVFLRIASNPFYGWMEDTLVAFIAD